MVEMMAGLFRGFHTASLGRGEWLALYAKASASKHTSFPSTNASSGQENADWQPKGRQDIRDVTLWRL